MIQTLRLGISGRDSEAFAMLKQEICECKEGHIEQTI